MSPDLPPRTRGPVEDLVRGAFGAGTRVDTVEDVGGDRRRSLIHRLTLSGADGPPSVIVKQLKAAGANGSGDHDQTSLFLAELSSLRFLTELGLDDLSPRLFAHDADEHILVMQDLGAGESMAEVLQRDPTPSSVSTLHAYARSMGRLHGASAARLDRFLALRSEVGAQDDASLWAKDVAHISAVEASLAWVDLSLSAAAAAELNQLQRRLTSQNAWVTFTHGDPCADNNIVTSEGSVVHFDFEFARARPDLVDGSYFVVPFPTCWCVNAIPSALRMAVTETYRAELATHLPEAGDPVRFGRALTDAAAFWVVRDITTRLLEGALKEDQTWGISTWRQRLIHRLPAFVELAHRHDHLPALAETAEALHRRLTGRWVALAPMPTYPALR